MPNSNNEIHCQFNIQSTSLCSDDGISFYHENPPAKNTVRRTTIPDRPNESIKLWPIISKFVGMDLSRIPIPVNFSEPLSLLQRVAEGLDYSVLLDTAASFQDNPVMEMAYLSAFIVASDSCKKYCISKPFNPLLGETYEFDRLSDLGWRTISEQVSHHPPTMAQHTQSENWLCYHETTFASKFRGKYFKISPLGPSVVHFRKSGNKYSWKKLPFTINNIIIGKLWVDIKGEINVVSHNTGHVSTLKFHHSNLFSNHVTRLVTGNIKDADGVVQLNFNGEWDSHLDAIKENGDLSNLWTAVKYPAENEKKYRFSSFTMELNAPEDCVANTDCRLRPDLRSMEQGNWDLANKLKVKLEEKQRNKSLPDYRPHWFQVCRDEAIGDSMYRYIGGYWNAKDKQDWSMCPDIFL